MQDDPLKRDWPGLKADIQARWPKLDAGDLLAIDGDWEYLLATLQLRYRLDRAAAEREYAAFVAGIPAEAGGALGEFKHAALDALGPGAAKIREGFSEIGANLRELAGESIDQGRDAVRSAAGDLGELGASARDGARQIAQGSGEALARTERFIRERPFTALGIAFVAGWLLFGRR